MSRRRRTAIAVAAAIAVVITLATGCGDNDPETDEPTTTPTPTVTPTKTLTPEQQAAKDAEAALTRYFEVTNKVGQDHTIPLSELETVAITTGLVNSRNAYGSQRQAGVVQVGDAAFDAIKTLEITLDNSAPQQGKVPTVEFQLCWDLTAVDGRDKNGKSVVNPNRMDRSIAIYRVSNYDYAKNSQDGWKVSGFERPMERTC